MDNATRTVLTTIVTTVVTVLTTVVLTAAFKQWWIALIGLAVVVGGHLLFSRLRRRRPRVDPASPMPNWEAGHEIVEGDAIIVRLWVKSTDFSTLANVSVWVQDPHGLIYRTDAGAYMIQDDLELPRWSYDFPYRFWRRNPGEAWPEMPPGDYHVEWRAYESLVARDTFTLLEPTADG